MTTIAKQTIKLVSIKGLKIEFRVSEDDLGNETSVPICRVQYEVEWNEVDDGTPYETQVKVGVYDVETGAMFNGIRDWARDYILPLVKATEGQ